jgi:hypothetical protein
MSQQVVINRTTPIGIAIAELLFVMFQHGEALPGVGEHTHQGVPRKARERPALRVPERMD